MEFYVYQFHRTSDAARAMTLSTCNYKLCRFATECKTKKKFMKLLKRVKNEISVIKQIIILKTYAPFYELFYINYCHYNRKPYSLK
jgi:hypothetical protein